MRSDLTYSNNPGMLAALSSFFLLPYSHPKSPNLEKGKLQSSQSNVKICLQQYTKTRTSYFLAQREKKMAHRKKNDSN